MSLPRKPRSEKSGNSDRRDRKVHFGILADRSGQMHLIRTKKGCVQIAILKMLRQQQCNYPESLLFVHALS